jgi:hypothetical protein
MCAGFISFFSESDFYRDNDDNNNHDRLNVAAFTACDCRQQRRHESRNHGIHWRD